jgi:hypothetical protein
LDGVTGTGCLRTVIVVQSKPLEPHVVDAIEAYFTSLQSHASAEQMRADVLTDDFETGFVDGLMWTGLDGLRDFIAARSVFFDEDHDLLQILEVGAADGGRVRARTRLRFSLRRIDPGAARSEEYTGEAFHTWLFQPEASGPWRVAAQLVDGFAAMNEPARRLFSTPEEGLHT